jgi:serine/threonine-protein kinase
VAVLNDAGLEADVHQVPSREPEGTVVAQAPKPEQTVRLGTEVRINVSSGPELVVVPSVLGRPYEDAAATLQDAGFSIARADVENEEPRGTVVGQNPEGNTPQPKGSKVTLSVSRGPTTTQVPDVIGFSEESARSALEGEGFTVRVRRRDVSTPEEADVVLEQFPAAGETGDAGSVVAITVGTFVEEQQFPPGE